MDAPTTVIVKDQWRLFRREAFAVQTIADWERTDQVVILGTQKLNHQAKPWIRGRHPPEHRHSRRRFLYCY